MDARPYSQSCENNKNPILGVLREALAEVGHVLEIGSGTGQHARYFAEQMPGICWQCTDLAQNLPGIDSWREGYSGDNLPPPLELDVRSDDWTVTPPEAVFTANSLHIMAWSAVESLFRRLGELAPPGSLLCVYGPFNYGGDYTSDSNARFDVWLGQQDPDSAIRDFEAVDALALAAGYHLQADHTMPANNRLLVWRKAPL